MSRAPVACALLMLVVGCAKKKDTPPSPTPTPPVEPGSASGQKPSDMKPEPVGKDEGDVKPPTAADLAAYTKDLPGSGKLMATIDTSMGPFHCELFADKSPMTVANFVGLATGKKAWLDPKSNAVQKGKPFYDGIIFHRVIPGFMVQTGDPLGQGVGGPGYQFANERSPDLKWAPGTMAMANAGPDTNGSQFFITEVATNMLGDGYTIFGKCNEVDLVKKIANVEKVCPSCPQGQPERERPKTDVTITKVTISKG
jgi:peptidyl-prolyl cis-trans isomerase A (cyclophilin A)